jgi:hypothetical protein
MNDEQRPARASDPAGEMMNLLMGAWLARLVHTAAELGIADQLGEAPRDAAYLAAATSTHAPSLARLLRALTAIGMLLETEDRRYTLTPLGATLRSRVPGSMRAWALLSFSDDQGKAWEALTHGVRTGEHAFRHIFGADLWTRLAERPEASRLFDEGMQSLTQGVYDTLITHYPFDNYKWIVDVGGGNGALLLPVAARCRDLRLTIFDLPHVADAARLRIAEQGLSPRCEAVSGDAFVSVPKGAPAYVLKGVIHDWEDEQAIQILRNCRAAMSDSAILLVIERILPERIDPNDAMTRAKFIADINMFLNPGGRERTEAEFRGLFAQAGLRLGRIVSPPGVQSIMEVEVI